MKKRTNKGKVAPAPAIGIIGERMAAFRRAKGWSQQQHAAEAGKLTADGVGIPLSTLSRIEREVNNVRVDTFGYLVAALELTDAQVGSLIRRPGNDP